MKKLFFTLACLFFAALAFGPSFLDPAHGARGDNKTPTFNKEVVRIFQNNCQSCHHPGYIAPFSLMKYEDAAPYAEAIKTATRKKTMPPWKASDGCGEFFDERILSAEEIDTLAKWADAGAPEGDPADLPTPLTFSGNWLLGTPEIELKSPEAYTVPASGNDVYRCFVLPHVFEEDRYVTAAEILPDAASVVHHVLLFLDGRGDSLKLDARDPGPGYTSFGGPGFTPVGGLGGWAPGNFPRFAPKGIGIKVPKGSRVVMQIHYHPNGTARPDQTRLGLHFADEPVESNLQSFPIVNPFFRIPPGERKYKVKAAFTVPPFINVKAVAITPHMHLLGQSMKVTATLPSGQKICLVNIPAWDFRWQGTYTYKEPISLPSGTRVEAVAYYDNSMLNPNNPNNPPVAVTWGEQTTDEMCLCFIQYVTDSGGKREERTVNGVPEVDEIQRQTATMPRIMMGSTDMLEQTSMKAASSLLGSAPTEMYTWADEYKPETLRRLPYFKYFRKPAKDGSESRCH